MSQNHTAGAGWQGVRQALLLRAYLWFPYTGVLLDEVHMALLSGTV